MGARAVTGATPGLEVSPEVQIGRENIDETTNAVVNTVTEVAGDQTVVNEGNDLAITTFLVILSIAFGMAIVDNLVRWLNQLRKRYGRSTQG